VFAAEGYEGATVEDITKWAGVSKGAYYFHFESKEDVLVALVQQWASEVSGSVGDIASNDLGHAGFRPCVDRLLAANDAAWPARLLLQFVSEAQRSERVGNALTAAQDAWRAAAAKLISKARRSGLLDDAVSPDGAAALLLAIRDGLILEACLPGRNTRAAARGATKMALTLLHPPRALRRVS
jgi:AcrR family transcriptional regulator